jgi:hypothetical protein
MADVATVSLSDDQIEKLLQEAEARLSDNQGKPNGSTTLIQRSTDQAVQVIKPQSAPSDKPEAPAQQTSSRDNLSVRVPEPRKSKKEMVRHL